MKGDRFLLAIDPGTRKCGLAIIEVSQRRLLLLKIVNLDKLPNILKLYFEEFMLKTIVIGDGTGYKIVKTIIEDMFGSKVKIYRVQERSTTLKARQLYVKMAKNPLDWLIRFIKSFFVNLDDLSAYIIGLRYLNNGNDITSNLRGKSSGLTS